VNESVGRGGPRRLRSRDRSCSGRKPRAGRRPDSRTHRQQALNTSRSSRSGFAAVNDEDVPGREIARSAGWPDTRRRKTHEGRVTAGLSPVSTSHRTRRESKALNPKTPAAARAHRKVWSQSQAPERNEGNGRRKAVRLAPRDETPEGKPWTWQRGETNPPGRRRSKPSRACETPRMDRQDRAGSSVHSVDVAG
jgi:hypothetical protein